MLDPREPIATNSLDMFASPNQQLTAFNGAFKGRREAIALSATHGLVSGSDLCHKLVELFLIKAHQAIPVSLVDVRTLAATHASRSSGRYAIRPLLPAPVSFTNGGPSPRPHVLE
jgi:hypothetical protein